MKKGIAGAALLALGLRLLTMTGAGEALTEQIREKLLDGRILTASINFELGGAAVGEREADSPAPSAVPTAMPPETASPVPGAAYAPTPSPAETPGETSPPADEEQANIVPTTIDGGLIIDNATSFEIGIEELMSQGLSLSLPAQGPQILIIHTHGSEAYTPNGADKYAVSDTMRTQDKEYSVIRVGDELTKSLESYGLNVLHDREIYDYPSYNGSYPRSGAAVEAYLEQYPGIEIVIDLHRDAIGTGDVVYKTVAEVSGEPASQIMLLAGTGENGLPHPHWHENLKLALYLQQAVNEKYKTLARPIAVKQERYNQHLTKGFLILEVGSSGNTLQEALCAVRLFADAVAEPLKALIAQ